MNSTLSNLMNRDSLTDQVCGHLEEAILSGELAPLSRLQSTRQLASLYGVSQKVVMSALDRLEEKRLVRRKARSGVFVSEQATDPEVLDALIFTFGDSPDRSPFVNRIAGVVSSEAAQGKIDFFSRHVTLSWERLHDRVYLRRRLDREIARLGNQFRPDVALVMGPMFDREDLTTCMDLPFPLLFVGDFLEGDFPGLSYNRLGFAFDDYDESVRWAADRGAERIVLMWGSNCDAPYFMEARKSLTRTAEQNGIEVAFIEVQNSHCSDPEKQKAGIAAAVKAYRQQADSEIIVLSCIYHHGYLVECLRQHGSKPLTDNLPIVSCEYEDFVPGMHYLRPSRQGLVALHRQLCDLMISLAEGALHSYREQFTMEREIVQ